jgi:DNA-binding PadR family transcriptional regulator
MRQISKGHMTFLVLDMLNDQRPRIRGQWVIEAFRKRHIPANKTNQASMNATFNRLKTAGIVEDNKTKQRQNEDFLTPWNSFSRSTDSNHPSAKSPS